MSKNVIHNFDILIQDSADVKSAEHLTDVMIKELAKISKEMSQQKDIEQLWQEQKSQNTAVNNSNFSAEGGVNDTIVKAGNNTALSVNNTPSVFGETRQTFNTSIGEGVADTIDSTMMSAVLSANTTSPILGVEEDALNLSKGVTNQIYSGVEALQMLTIPEKLQPNGEPTLEAVNEAIRKKLELATTANDTAAVEYWTRISKAFDEGASVQDFEGKPNHALFTEMYAALKQLNSVATTQNFNWEIVREKMIKAIDANILFGKISEGSKKRWKIIQQELQKDSTNVANLFEQYNELFLLLGQVEGLDDLPGTITITTKTKIYPNLSADRLYGKIGREAVYVFLKEISYEDVQGNAVKRGAVKIKNTAASSFIVGETLEFFLDETLIVQNGNKNEGINWIVYKARKGKKYEETIFEDEGISFSYNFDTEGVFIIEAYGYEHGANNKKSKKSFAFVEIKIVTQELVITPPITIKDKFIRPLAEEQIFKISLSNPELSTLQPLKLYYQIEIKNSKSETKTSDLTELDSTSEIKLSLSDFAEYKIIVSSKDQYGLYKEFAVETIKNYVSSVIAIKENGNPSKAIYFMNEAGTKVFFKIKSFKIEPATKEERENVKWLVYDQNSKIYVPNGMKILNESNDIKRPYVKKGETFEFPVPKKEGDFTVEAYSNNKDGIKTVSGSVITVRHPKITEAYWAYNNGDKKKVSGFSGEINHVRGVISNYDNQPVRISVFLNDSKIANFYNDTKTNSRGEIDQTFDFNLGLQQYLRIKNGQSAKIRFELNGIQNEEVFSFKTNNNVYKDAALDVTAAVRITDLYFEYENSRVNLLTPVPFGAKVKGVIKTLNKAGQEVVLKIYKNTGDIIHTARVKVNNEGVAIINFTLNKEWNIINPLTGIMDTIYLGMEGIETRLSLENGMNAVVDNNIESSDAVGIDENNPQLIWGAKVSKEFRVKVFQICKRLWPKKTLEMANGLMAVMHRETDGTFAPHQIEGKALIPKEKLTRNSFDKIRKGKKYSRAVGLIQFTQAALTSMGEYTGGGLDVLNELKLKYAKMTQLDQLSKVEDYMKKVKTLPVIPEDIYMAVFAPAYLGLELDKTIYQLGTIDYGENASLDVDKTKNGIQIKELITEYYESLRNGEYGRNIWRNPLDRMELRGWYSTWRPNDSKFGIVPKRDKGKHEGIDLYAPVGTPVRACVDGLIVFNSTAGGYGNTVVLKGYYESKLYYFAYSHLREKSKFIADKSWVKAGEVIGHTGQSGNAESLTSEKTHLHFEVRPLKEWGDKSKEFRGRVNPLEEIKELFVVLDPKKEKQI
ncbi:M23 family metallopeptidase [Flavobacterium tructae]|uniref:M23 family metallopeptidase n=1 Tax=Flavobacterium tructae TaxID=1114873 RepID=UPI002551F946|nr:M23 family metallopeptidase [Flavobacterium tructae]MDL2142850.1 M23 family metallopeptidase [Flavobacterium tructae]